MNNDCLDIELISKEKTIEILSQILKEYSIKPDIQSGILLSIMDQKVAFDVNKVLIKLKSKDDDCGDGKIFVREAISIVEEGYTTNN